MVKIENLNVKYHNTGKEALAGVSFSIEKGEIVAILGPSGCGKTTLLNVIAGILARKDADISGKVSHLDNGNAISMVFQTPCLLPWRGVHDNVIFGLEIRKKIDKETDRAVDNIIRIVGLSGYEDYYPAQLSLGMQQRVNFARAVITHPDLLILDEPFASLDQDNKEKIRVDFLKILKEKKITSVFVTHDKDEARVLADKVVILTASPARVEKIINRADYES